MNDFIDLILLIARKMLAVYKHKEAYHAEERRFEETFEADPAAPRVHCQELFEEFDVFVVEIKSTLDHMVKAMRPMLGKKWTMCTFASSRRSGQHRFRRSHRNLITCRPLHKTCTVPGTENSTDKSRSGELTVDLQIGVYQD